MLHSHCLTYGFRCGYIGIFLVCSVQVHTLARLLSDWAWNGPCSGYMIPRRQRRRKDRPTYFRHCSIQLQYIDMLATTPNTCLGLLQLICEKLFCQLYCPKLGVFYWRISLLKSRQGYECSSICINFPQWQRPAHYTPGTFSCTVFTVQHLHARKASSGRSLTMLVWEIDKQAHGHWTRPILNQWTLRVSGFRVLVNEYTFL